MAKVISIEIKRKIRIGERNFSVKTLDPFFRPIRDSIVEATASQLRNLALYGRDLMIDKLLAAYTHGAPVRVYRRKVNQTARERIELERRDPRDDPRSVTINEDVIVPRVTSVPWARRRPFQHEPLSKAYLDWKLRHKLDPRILVATGDYIRGLTVRRYKQKKAGIYYVLTTVNRRHRPSGLMLNQIAKIHEYGTHRYLVPFFGDRTHLVAVQIPARPHWRPVYKELKKLMKKLGSAVMAETLKLALRKLT